jgi:hypothetical protein
MIIVSLILVFIDIDTYTEGYVTIPISDLVFVDREFHDPDHF